MSSQTTLVHTREDTTSPIKKKFRESSTTISRAELDGAILAGVKQALSKQQTDLDRIVTAAIKSAIDDVLTPQISDLKREVSFRITAQTPLRKGRLSLRETKSLLIAFGGRAVSSVFRACDRYRYSIRGTASSTGPLC
ncbi:hypothetical protein QQF64_009515 [Cirrhinus molitorella]|uniref:Uncharacterized protein n=1 Tax=Cirrhinus molitorella TaxID=172907 RepID=A0ABR3M1E0_9TELE